MFNLEAVDPFTSTTTKFLEKEQGKISTTFYKKYYPKLIFYTSKFCNDIQKQKM